MKGYVINITSGWTHAMKRSIGPGAKIPLDELFEQYGAKHDLKEGEEFAEWLRSVKLQDIQKWKVVVEDDNTETTNKADSISEDVDSRTSNKVGAGTGVTPMVVTKTEVVDVVGFSVREAREKLPNIKDLNLLKYALQEANQLAGKDSLCKIIRKRIRDLQIAR